MHSTRQVSTGVASDPSLFREMFSHFPQGVVLIGAVVDGIPHGLVVSTFTAGVSLEPPLVSFAIQHTSRTWPRLQPATRLGVSLMGRDQLDIIPQLASTQRESRFDDVDFHVDDEGTLTLSHVPAWMTTRVHDVVRAGDHNIVLLEVLNGGVIPGAEAMVFHQRSFKETAPLNGSAFPPQYRRELFRRGRT